jgi:hypothetical protein
MEIAEDIVKYGMSVSSKCDFISVDFLDICELLDVYSEKNDVRYLYAKDANLSEVILFVEEKKVLVNSTKLTNEFLKEFFGVSEWMSRSNYSWKRSNSLENVGMVVTFLTAEDVAVSICIPFSSIISLSNTKPKEIIKEGYAYITNDGQVMICERIYSERIVWSWSVGEQYFESAIAHFIPGYSMGYVGSTFSEFETEKDDILKIPHNLMKV